MQIIQRTLVAILCLNLSATTLPGSAWAATPPAIDNPTASSSPKLPHTQLTSEERIVHALNRFTFGPRPGDIETVKAMGLDHWFAQQLHPASINDSALPARLAQFPAMQWSPEELLLHLPSNAIIRQIVDGKVTIPNARPDTDSTLQSIYQNQISRLVYRREQARPEEQKAPTTNSTTTPGIAANSMNAAASLSTPAPNSSSIATLLSMPPQQRVESLANMPQPYLDAFLKSLTSPERAALTADLPPNLKETVGALENPEAVVVNELLSTRLTHDIYAQAQLQEVMTDFWLNHFNVYLRKNEATPYYLVSYERDVIRPHALGKFEDLLENVAHSPAMLFYLDNSSSTGPNSPSVEKSMQAAARNGNRQSKREGLNENYARELMELHTLGVNGGYTQADVIETARILTGWTVDRPQRGGGFRFDANRHEPGTKKVMGKKFAENGEQEGRDLLHFLATRPATARFISRKLAIRFVSDDPPQSLIDRMAKSYLSSGGDIAKVLETMYHSPEFWSSAAYRAKIKTPLEYVVSAARASNADIPNMAPLVNALQAMGMPLYGSIPPTGYMWDAADWVSTAALVNRMNFALSLTANRLNGITTTWTANDSSEQSAAPAPPQPASPEEDETRLEAQLVAGGVSQATRAAVLQQFAAQSTLNQSSRSKEMPGDRQNNNGRRSVTAIPSVFRPQPNHRPPSSSLEKQDQLLAGLLLGSPEFQRR